MDAYYLARCRSFAPLVLGEETHTARGSPVLGEASSQDRWNCKCRLEATDEPASPDDLVEDMPAPQLQRGLDNNPGKDGHLINDTHPYFPENCARCPFYSPKGIKNRIKAAFQKSQKKTVLNVRI